LFERINSFWRFVDAFPAIPTFQPKSLSWRNSAIA